MRNMLSLAHGVGKQSQKKYATELSDRSYCRFLTLPQMKNIINIIVWDEALDL